MQVLSEEISECIMVCLIFGDWMCVTSFVNYG